jgi:hypothetical protein
VDANGGLSASTGNLSKHLREKHSTVHVATTMRSVALTNATGIPSRALELPFHQQLEHHIRYAFAICEDHNAVRTRGRPAMEFFVQQLLVGYRLPHADTLKKVLRAITEAQLRSQMRILASVKAAAKGGPCVGMQLDLWTKRKLRDAFVSVRLTFVTEDRTAVHTKHQGTNAGARTFHDMLLKFGHFTPVTHSAKNIARWLLRALSDVGLTPADITLATPDGAANGLKALRIMGVMFDACIEHQLDRAVSHSTGEGTKGHAANPACHDLIVANAKMAAKIVSSTKLQLGLCQKQLEEGIRLSEALVIIKRGVTR